MWSHYILCISISSMIQFHRVLSTWHIFIVNFIHEQVWGVGGGEGDETRFGKHLMVTNKKKTNKGCVTLWPCHLHLKSILRQKKNYGNSIISPCQNNDLQQILYKKNPKSLRYYNSMITNLKFQHKPKYHLSKMLILKNRPNITLGAKIH